MHITRTQLLPLALKLDAVVTGANGLAYAALAGPLSEPLGVGEAPLRLAGLALIAFAAAVWALGSRAASAAGEPGAAVAGRGAVWAVIAVNVAWAVESVVLVAAGIADPVLLGGVWIVAQAFVVGGFAALQFAGLRAARSI